jgi:hypothetical protein
MSRTLVLTILVLLFSADADAITISESVTGMTASVYQDGTYVIYVQDPSWTFSGSLSGPPQHAQQSTGADGIGTYDEITFQFVGGTPMQGGIRLYRSRAVVLFTLRLLAAGSNNGMFPSLTSYPAGLYHLTNSGWRHYFDMSVTDGPLVEFDSSAQTFIISPASNFLIATTSIGPDQSITSGVSARSRACLLDSLTERC